MEARATDYRPKTEAANDALPRNVLLVYDASGKVMLGPETADAAFLLRTPFPDF